MIPRPLDRAAGGQSGFAAVELVLVAPLLVILLLLVVTGGRLAAAQGDVQAAARDAARAATLARDPSAALVAARQAAQVTVDGGVAPCASTVTELDLTGFAAGGTVTARVTCQVLLADLGLLGLPGSRPVIGEATSPVDRYRGLS